MSSTSTLYNVLSQLICLRMFMNRNVIRMINSQHIFFINNINNYNNFILASDF